MAAACSDDAGVSSGADAGDASDLAGNADRPPGTPAPMDGLYTAEVTEVVLEIDYEAGAEPATGGLLDFGDPWTLFETNAAELFAEQPRTLTVPHELSGMEALGELEGTDFTVQEILELAAEHRDEVSTDSRRTFYILYVDGYFEDSSGRRENVLGVSLGDTGVIAMFKRVIGSGPLRTQVEQATLIHEFGHAVGLVNNGVPLTSEHHDVEHGAHCSNPDCVMYWTVAGPDVANFVTAHVTDNRAVLFGEECLDDVRAAD